MTRDQEVTDFRFFVRCIIRHYDLVTRDASFDYLESEGERTVMEALDALEFAMSHPQSVKTDCNHIFLNFASTLTVKDPSAVRRRASAAVVTSVSARSLLVSLNYVLLNAALLCCDLVPARVHLYLYCSIPEVHVHW